MELDFALLALNADVGEGGKIHIFGGAFDQVRVPSVPAHFPPFVLISRFILPQDEAGQTHTFEINVVNPAGEVVEVGEPREITSTKPENLHPQQWLSSAIVAQVMMLFLSTGQYVFQVKLDGTVVKRLPVLVQLQES